MTLPAGPVKIKFLVKSKVESELIPRAMKRLFLLLHIVFALDFGFINNKSPRMKLFVKLFYFTQASALTIAISCYLLYMHSEVEGTIWYFTNCIAYFVTALILLISKNTYYDFQLNLHVFDTEIGADSSSYKIEYKILAYISCLTVLTVVFSIAFCLTQGDRCIYHLGVISSCYMFTIGFQIALIVFTFLFTSVSNRIKKFTEYVGKDNVDVIECHYLYKRIAETTEKTKKTFDFIFALALLLNTLDATLTVYEPFSSSARIKMTTLCHPNTAPRPGHFFREKDSRIKSRLNDRMKSEGRMIEEWRSDESWKDGAVIEGCKKRRAPAYKSTINYGSYTIEMPLVYILVVQELVIVFSPAFTAGLLASQVECLRLVLYDRLVKDDKHTRDLKRFISYVETRPLRFKVWTVIPLDWSLPVIVLNLCVTYLIVMIQFTQKN